MDAEIFTESFKQGVKRTTSQRRAQETDRKKKKEKKKKPCLVWHVAHMASNNKGFLRTHAAGDKTGSPTNNTFTWAAEKNRARRSVPVFWRNVSV